MAEQQSAADKTEKATPQKLRKSREQGQVPRSRDWATAVGVVLCLNLVAFLAPGYLEDFRKLFGLGFASLAEEGALGNLWSTAFATTMLLIFKMVLPLAVVPVLVAASGLYPGGWVFTAKHLEPRLDRVNPLSYFKRVLGLKHWSSVLASIAKAAALIAVLVHIVRSGTAGYLHLQSLPVGEALGHGARMALDGALALGLVFVIFALIDLPLQIFIYLRDQRMTKRDLKEEYKTTEGRPEVRQRIRQLQLQMARRAVRKAVPTADVVIVNPEHYAVALKYDEHRAEAPFVVAKGVDETALYIRELAAEHGVEVLTLPPLARAIYNTSQVNQQIPAALYKAVAQVLTYVLQLKAFRGGRRAGPPQWPAELAVPSHLT